VLAVLHQENNLTDIQIKLYYPVQIIGCNKATLKRRLTEVMSGESHPDR
jgi:hypothetical protein